VNTLRALEEGLENFAGCAMVISHDRWFLDRIATHISWLLKEIHRCISLKAAIPNTRKTSANASAMKALSGYGIRSW
jgi:ATPase subunit of ABC transporter with duplicated ATPase domains